MIPSMPPTRRIVVLALLLACLPVSHLGAQVTSTPFTSSAPVTGSADGQTWTQETLGNGLRVIYAPMPTSPVTQVRVLYHVGSRDERTDRTGFAHMFEHMMFRGSAHVAPEQHAKLIGQVGGYTNAYTSFDETVYHDTQPANYTELALWLEADRMSSFKVSPEIFYTERNVVSEEWRMRLNQPYGGMFELLMPEIFKTHPYQWTPIGSMAHLQAAKTAELQAFFEKYYVPNNAILVIAGNIDIPKTRDLVKKYYAWIPGRGTATDTNRGTGWLPLERNIPAEPPQTAPRRLEIKMPAPLARVILTFRAPPEGSEDIDALNLMLGILGDGQSSRIYQSLVTSDDPLAVEAGAYLVDLEDGGIIGIEATILKGKDPAAVEKQIKAAVAAIREKPVTAEELAKVKQQARMALATRFETAEKVAGELGQEMLIRNNLDRVTTARKRLEALTPADLQRVAQKYLPDAGTNIMVVTPGTPEGQPLGAPLATAPASEPADTQINARPVTFPADYPAKPPMAGELPAATFEKGVETTVELPQSNGANNLPKTSARVIVMEDHRMPIINWSLALRTGGHAEPKGKEGLAGLTASMVRRGPKGKTFDQFNEDLESRAISLEVGDGGDTTRISGSCLKEQFSYAMKAMADMLYTPAFDAGEFKNLQNQALSELRLSLNSPTTLASRELTKALYGDSPLGRLTTVESLTALSLDDVKKHYENMYRGNDAILMISGDITVNDGQATAKTLLGGIRTGVISSVNYTLPKPPTARRILLIDKPEAKQAAIRFGIPAYSIQSEEKFAGTLANQILSAGLESRLPKYVRSEKGYVYDVYGIFSPSRHAGHFGGAAGTSFENAGDAVTAIFKVLEDMRAANVPDQELADAKFRVSGSLLMSMQTVSEQADRRLEGMLNGYPIDYYDKFAQRIAQVSADQIRANMTKYVLSDHMIVVVAGPAATLKPKLDKIGTVEIITPAP